MVAAARVWARCARPEHLPLIQTIADRLADDGDHIDFVTTQSDHPETRRAVRQFLAQNTPILILWIGGELDEMTIQQADAQGIPVVLMDADEKTANPLTSRWFPMRNRLTLSRVKTIFARTNTGADALVRAGADPDCVTVTGPFEEGVNILPYLESERYDIASALQTRPVWLARAISLDEVPMLANAQRQAARRSHRLLLIASVLNEDDAPAIAQAFADLGLALHSRAAGDEPGEATQVYLADLEGEDGLWLRIAPICYAGGSLTNAARNDPFQAAALGSVVIHGDAYGAFSKRFQRLMREGASYGVGDETQLGTAVETLLSTERVARMAMAGWDVTSSGTDMTNQVVALIQEAMDEAPVA